MKKLMIAAAMVCAAAMSYGAAGDWSVGTTDGGGLLDPTGTENIGGTLYLFNYVDEVFTQDTLLAALRNNGDIDELAAAHGWAQSFTVGDDGTFFTKITGGPTTDQTLFEVVKVGSDYYIDMEAEYGHDTVVGGAIELPLSYSGDGVDFRNDSTATYAANGYGWYSTVPEPTSGLLLLLGVAGLALRRRRA